MMWVGGYYSLFITFIYSIKDSKIPSFSPFHNFVNNKLETAMSPQLSNLPVASYLVCYMYPPSYGSFAYQLFYITLSLLCLPSLLQNSYTYAPCSVQML